MCVSELVNSECVCECETCTMLIGQACDALTDDDEAVRTVAVRLICSLVRRTPEALVAVPQQPPLPSRDVRMCDDAFARVCDLLNDVSMPVRALAAGKLGDFCSVSSQLLEQTLDKKLMSHLKVCTLRMRLIAGTIKCDF